MNCDEVFAILTRGPFPSGDRFDRIVETHLRQCPSCQQLAEALRPNDDVHPEAIAPEDSLALPGYWGGRLHAESRPAVSITQATNLNRPQPRPRAKPAPPYRGINLWQFAAAIVLGVAAAVVLRAMISPPAAPPSSYPSGLHGASASGVVPHELKMCADGTRLFYERHNSYDDLDGYSASSAIRATECAHCHQPRSWR